MEAARAPFKTVPVAGAVPPRPFKPAPGQSDARFKVCVAHLFKLEGGLNDIRQDRGGITNFGISLRFAAAEARIDPDTRRLLDMDMDGDVDGADIRDLTPDAAAAVYRRCFWDRYRCGELRPRMDGAVFDQAVNGGGISAVKLLQQAVNLARAWPELVVDGRIGPMTLKAANSADPGRVITFMQSLARARYEAIVRADPTQSLFLRGWRVRAGMLGRV